MNQYNGSRVQKWSSFLLSDVVGKQIFTCVQASVPLWTKGTSLPKKVDFLARKIDMLYSTSCDPAHGTSVELYKKTANATMMKSNNPYNVQALIVMGCVCTTLGIVLTVEK